ncbi:MAG TPA: SMC family ATPase [Nocardioidaceae bacterium]|nr:SMC family ATPase [Nocardioidaceae bacterium]
MRLHRLQVTAFGPFAGTETVDFDLLDGAGLFLLTGATGAGKTSLLDAVCFALYGAVPGARGVKQLHCQHAPPGSRPEVELEFSVSGRRFVVRRSPEWTRPKRRGTGELTEHASARLLELSTDTAATGDQCIERLVSSRAQEVGHFLADLIGMTLTQFVQVAMLPQGEFQTFLRAGSQDRHDVLQQLFGTDRFARIEQWMHERSTQLAEQESCARGEVRRVLDTMAARSGTPLPEHLDADRLGDASPDAVRSWADQVVTTARATLAKLHAGCESASKELQAARAAHTDAAVRASNARRRDAARQEVEELTGRQGEAATVADLVEADGRAVRCADAIAASDQAEREHATTRAGRTEALARLEHVATPEGALARIRPGDVTAAELADAARTLRERGTATETVRSRDEARALARTRLREIERSVTEKEQLLADDERRLAELTVALAAARQARDDVVHAVPEEDLQQALQAARARQAAAARIPAVTRELADREEVCRDARDAKTSAQERLNDVVARRLSGIAAELAGRLQDGHPCQVCGNTSHPSPAAADPDAVTDADQARAEEELAATATAHDSAVQAVAGSGRTLAALQATAQGADREGADAQVAALERELEDSRCARAQRESLETRVLALAEEHQEVAARVNDTRTTLATQRQSADTHRQTVLTASAEIADATGCADPDRPWAEILSELVAAHAVVEEVAATLVEDESAERRHDELLARATASAHDQGFPDLDAARAALLPEERRAELTRAHEEGAARLAAARHVLGESEMAEIADAATEQTLAELDRCALALQEAEDAHTRADRAHHLHDDLTDALTRCMPELDAALSVWQPARTHAERASAMALLVRGRGHDNHLQMRLSAFVLATRLDQVLDAANLRLAQMRDQRYLLARTGRASRSNARAGLDLEILDQWTGESRAPTTLSGGETFVVSLSLALGLADVVTQEAGGTEIDTLFIDEGFGSLDADTLDDVMDRLDELRASGRVVGVVSHVSELRERIPTQVRVDKTRSGSTVRVHSLVG